jgi:signal transduction histidine kinase
MERLRTQAAALTATGADRRLDVPRTRDEVQRLALTLNAMLDRLAQAMAAERAFLARAGHELRTPLAALQAEVDVTLRRPHSAPELTSALHSVSEETDRLARLADDLLVLGRAADGPLPLRREPVCLHELLTSAAARFAAQADQRGVTVTVDAAGEVDADPLRLRQVLANLLANALRYTPPGGGVLLTADAGDGGARIVVEDDGPGFDRSPSGDGLGLRIVDAIVAAHGGTVDVTRGAGGGARVTITLPRAAAPVRPE